MIERVKNTHLAISVFVSQGIENGLNRPYLDELSTECVRDL